MKIIELFESQFNHEVFNTTSGQIAKLNKLSNDFDSWVTAIGFEGASSKLEAELSKIKSMDWYNDVGVNTNSKLKIQRKNRDAIISKLELRMKAGL
jgi:hypothetical protein